MNAILIVQYVCFEQLNYQCHQIFGAKPNYYSFVFWNQNANVLQYSGALFQNNRFLYNQVSICLLIDTFKQTCLEQFAIIRTVPDNFQLIVIRARDQNASFIALLAKLASARSPVWQFKFVKCAFEFPYQLFKFDSLELLLHLNLV